jgi:hypothetical protein
MGQHAAREELVELLLDEAGQAISIAALGDFLEEGKGSRCSRMTAWRTEWSVSRG